MINDKLLVFKEFATSLATLSHCEQRGVAALIIDEDLQQIYSIGVNGGVAKGIQCLCTLPGKETCVHAEAQALAKCTTDVRGKTVIVTLSPCITCATLMINSGIARVYYVDEWKDIRGLDLLRSVGVTCIQI